MTRNTPAPLAGPTLAWPIFERPKRDIMQGYPNSVKNGRLLVVTHAAYGGDGKIGIRGDRVSEI